MPADIIIGERRLSAGGLADRADRLAGGLRARGLREGDVIALLLRNSVAFLDVILACRRLGCYYCPLNWHLTSTEIDFILRDSGARLLIADEALLAPLADTLPAGLDRLIVDAAGVDPAGYEHWLAAQHGYDGPLVAPRAHMAYTSGTTGTPKGVQRLPVALADIEDSQRRLRQVAEVTMGLAPGTRALVTAPIYHSAPSVFTQNALQQSELLVVMETFDPERFLQLVQTHRIDTTYLVPIMYVRLLQLPADVRARYDVSSLRFVASTGAPCPPAVKQAMLDWFGPVIYETYGSSEAGMATLATPDQAARKPGTAGLPVGRTRIRILDDACQPCPPGAVGRVFVHQPDFPDFTYRNRPQARAEIDHDGMVCLGDMGYLDDEGYLFLSDRASHLVISGGVNIYPAEIEQQLVQYPGVADCAVFGIPDDEFGERLMALVQPRADAPAPPEPQAIVAWLGTRLARFKVPREIELRDALPRDENGKIAVRRLREPYWQGRSRRI